MLKTTTAGYQVVNSESIQNLCRDSASLLQKNLMTHLACHKQERKEEEDSVHHGDKESGEDFNNVVLSWCLAIPR